MTTATRELPARADYERGAAYMPGVPGARIASIDIVRGIVMVMMAIDHVRVYAGVPAGGPAPGVFFTRWITNFVAPAFAFLAGTGAFLYGRRVKERAQLSRYLATRGVMLVLLELTFLRFAWTFNFDYAHYVLAGVIWMLGWCMVLLAGMVWLPVAAIGTIGVAIIALHNVADHFGRVIGPALSHSPSAWFWQLLYYGGPVQLGRGGPVLAVLYSIVPWIGVMAAGYAFGVVTRLSPERRARVCYALGFGALALFLVLRGFDLYGDPRPWSAGPARMPALFRFLNTAKYPASLSFLLMTLGPMFIAIPLAERAHGAAARVLSIFGRVPLFFYVLHIPAIHLAAVVVSFIRQGSASAWLFTNHPMMNPEPPPGYRWSLALLYLVWAVVVAALYFPCRWYARVKAERRSAWMSYL